ncbi:hypothetical protein GCM10009798_38630 [Nocardioides panacihumi]|uniref:Uncharacterized protein n=1 Tax=Nocardioides panacihumi TaxID=400774 RepID=A0ABP5D4E6_9ACTN
MAQWLIDRMPTTTANRFWMVASVCGFTGYSFVARNVSDLLPVQDQTRPTHGEGSPDAF